MTNQGQNLDLTETRYTKHLVFEEYIAEIIASDIVAIVMCLPIAIETSDKRTLQEL